ncbi:MAG: nucleic acid-binding protein [Pyrinomonadaceae bacterium]
MKVFADAVYWIALFNPRDQWRAKALSFGEPSENRLVTTDDVLIETLNYFAESGQYFRKTLCQQVENVLLEPNIEIVEASHELFLDAFHLYSTRLDKGYSLTDCISMNICRAYGIADVLTHDDHFRQEGFNVLL